MAIHKIIATDHFEQLHYTVEGNGNAVVLIHGFPLDGTIWQVVAKHLALKHKVIVPDMPGSGQSKNNDPDLTVEKMADSIKVILDNEKVDSAVIAGHSMGGYVGLAFAEVYPEVTNGLALVHSSATADSSEKKEHRLKTIELIKNGGKEHFIRQMIPNLFASTNKDAFSEQLQQLISIAMSTTEESLAAFYNAMIKRPDRTSNLNNNDLPLCWVIGKEDQIMPYKGLLQQTTLTNVNFIHVYENVGHMGMIEAPRNLSTDLDNFVKHCFN